jgi:hypothetical protein
VPKQVLTPKRSWIARIAVLALAFSLIAVALPASAHSVPLDTAVSCPSSTPSAGFTDIAAFDATTQLAINCLAAFDITQGTSATTYSPNDTVKRWQMALFLIRQAKAHGVTIPAPVNQGFTDIGGLDQATQDAINQLAQLGISKGTTTTTFSPNDDVARWQMALFLRRLAGAAGVAVADDPAHNTFGDIGSLSAEAQAAINFLADGHIALGTGASNFSPFDVVFRWSMALFLTRVLAADGIIQPGSRVSVSPTTQADLGVGLARTYVATFKNVDGSAYTGSFGIQLVEASSGLPVYNDVADFIVIEASTDNPAGVGTATVTGTAGTDGTVTFTIRHAGAVGEDTIPVAWIDSDNNLNYNSAGNVAPNEPFGLGGVANFVAGPPAEGANGTLVGNLVISTLKGSDSFVVGTGGVSCPGTSCTLFYDATNDIFSVDGVAATLDDFEAALSAGDTVNGTYASNPEGQSTFNLTDAIAPLVVTDPAAATSIDAASYAIKGTADPGAAVRIHQDLNNNGLIDVGEGIVATGTADADGAWTVTTPLTQNAANNFVATQVPVGGVASAPVDVPTITEAVSAGATITASAGANAAPGVPGVLDPLDTFTLTFSENLSGVGGADSVTLTDTDGTTATFTHGVNATFTPVGLNGIMVQVTAATPGTGNPDGIEGVATVAAVGGFTDDDGEAINVTGSGAARSFGGF